MTAVAKAINVAVILTIHQPSALVFDMLDDLLLLCQGRVVYAGAIKDASLSHHNVLSLLFSILSVDIILEKTLSIV